MKKLNLLLSASLILIALSGNAQETSEPESISKSLGLFVYPNDGNLQDTLIQYNEYSCYTWAKEQTGIDPMNIKVETADVATGPDGTAVKGAAKGAAVGATIGAITGDAGEGAAVGATMGGVQGIGRGRKKRMAQKKQAQQSAQQQKAQALETFKKAYSACMEAKGYTVK